MIKIVLAAAMGLVFALGMTGHVLAAGTPGFSGGASGAGGNGAGGATGGTSGAFGGIGGVHIGGCGIGCGNG